ncbi:MAG: putative membrane protein [Arenicella sp.]|jgi:uncharacterized membrane protein
MKNEKLIKDLPKTLGAVIATSIMATALLGTSSIASAASTERCADIVKGGKNSCAVKTLGTSCQGQATADNTVGAWIKVPAGTCGNIVSICVTSAEAPAGTSQKKITRACEKIADQIDETVAGGRLVDKYGDSI